MTEVKVIKLNGRYKLYREYRFTHAIRFSSWAVNTTRVEQFFRDRYGSEYNRNFVWKTHWGKPGKHTPRPYMIGVKDEEMIFVAKLAGVI